MITDKQVDVSELIESQKASWFRIWIMVMGCAIMILEGYDVQVLAYAAPSIIKAWNVNRALFGPIFGFSLFGYMLGATLLSNFADRMGRKKDHPRRDSAVWCVQPGHGLCRHADRPAGAAFPGRDRPGRVHPQYYRFDR